MIFCNKVKYYDEHEICTLPFLGNRRLRRVTPKESLEMILNKDYKLTYETDLSNEYYRVYRDKSGNLYFTEEES